MVGLVVLLSDRFDLECVHVWAGGIRCRRRPRLRVWGKRLFFFVTVQLILERKGKHMYVLLHVVFLSFAGKQRPPIVRPVRFVCWKLCRVCLCLLHDAWWLAVVVSSA